MRCGLHVLLTKHILLATRILTLDAAPRAGMATVRPQRPLSAGLPLRVSLLVFGACGQVSSELSLSDL